MERPMTGDHDVLVRVHATTVNRTDCVYRAAHPFSMRLFTGLVRPHAPVLGNEFAGAWSKRSAVNVTAVCGTEHVGLVKALGASKVIDCTAEDFTKENQSYDVVLDSVGKSYFSQCEPLLKSSGIYISEVAPGGVKGMSVGSGTALTFSTAACLRSSLTPRVAIDQG
jgi:NADPH:quinone reductase-like Zn-dependent oxidoreductase